MAMNYMVFGTGLDRARKAARMTHDAKTIATTEHASIKARECYRAKDYAGAESWRNAAIRASLQMC